MGITPFGVVGVSHLGLVTGIGLATKGYDVVMVDSKPDSVAALSMGRLPVYEPELDQLRASVSDRLTFSTDYGLLGACGCVFFALDTVTDEANRANLSGLEAEISRALHALPQDGVVVIMSQVPVGYTRGLGSRLRDRRPDLQARLYYWVETLVIGDSVARFLRPERIILGCPEPGNPLDPVLETLVGHFDCPIFRLGYESAELAKAAVNLYLSLSVSFANLMAELCEAAGGSMRDIVPALRSDRRIGRYAYIRPSLGIAGGNLERDLVQLRALCEERHVDPGLLDWVLTQNYRRYDWLLRQLQRHVYPRALRPRLALWGLAYKKDTRSTKNSPALRLIGDLAGRATITVYDPKAALPSTAAAAMAPSKIDALKGADCLVVLTDWDEFSICDYQAMVSVMNHPVIVDCVGCLDRDEARAMGFQYVAIGEGA